MGASAPRHSPAPCPESHLSESLLIAHARTVTGENFGYDYFLPINTSVSATGPSCSCLNSLRDDLGSLLHSLCQQGGRYLQFFGDGPERFATGLSCADSVKVESERLDARFVTFGADALRHPAWILSTVFERSISATAAIIVKTILPVLVDVSMFSVVLTKVI